MIEGVAEAVKTAVAPVLNSNQMPFNPISKVSSIQSRRIVGQMPKKHSALLSRWCGNQLLMVSGQKARSGAGARSRGSGQDRRPGNGTRARRAPGQAQQSVRGSRQGIVPCAILSEELHAGRQV